nr:MAG TPA: hypothetical protein [Caudoviricetes sp.]
MLCLSKSLIFKYLQIIFVFFKKKLFKYLCISNICHTFATSNKRNDKQNKRLLF